MKNVPDQPEPEDLGRSRYLRMGQTVWVDDELRTGIECTIQGFNRDREPILEAVDGPLRFRGSDRHVLDVPWEKVQTEEPEATLLEAAKALIEQERGFFYSPRLGALEEAVEREERKAEDVGF